MSKAFFDMLEEKISLTIKRVLSGASRASEESVARQIEAGATCRNNELKRIEKVTKSVRGMPWLSEARKDVISCDKLRGGANNP